jgi:hypothetical protein
MQRFRFVDLLFAKLPPGKLYRKVAAVPVFLCNKPQAQDQVASLEVANIQKHVQIVCA